MRRWRPAALALVLVARAAGAAGPVAAVGASSTATAARAAKAGGGAYRESAHADPDRGVKRLARAPRGACVHCHSRDPGVARPPPVRGQMNMLFAADDNGLCFGCHRIAQGTFLGETLYDRGPHATDSTASWPGPQPPARPVQDAGKCVNCHDPHAARDASGVIPSMLRVRGDALCLGCHAGGSATKDIGASLRLPYRHPAAPVNGAAAATALAKANGLPVPAKTSAPTAVAPRDGCSACHNAHAAAPDVTPPRAPAASATLAGVVRARVANGAPGAEPHVTVLGPDDQSPASEHEVCFACHAGRTASRIASATAPLSVAAQLNPANASFHPVEAAGKNPGIDRNAFTPGWSADRLVYCSDCHSGDEGRVRGPHGSSYPHLLARRNPTAPGDRMVATDLCFDCHAWKTYGDPAGGAAFDYSRFPGHAPHVARGASCYACHDTHGSAGQPALIALRFPGLVSYTQDTQGGTCAVNCHSTTPATIRYRAAYHR